MADLAGTKTAYLGFSGIIESSSVTRICAAFNAAANNNYDEIYLCFNSLGGYVGDGIYLYNHIRSLPLKFTAHNTGSVMSIGVAVFVAAEERLCSAHGMFMIHPTKAAVQDTTWEVLNGAREAALADDERTENILRGRTGIPNETLAARRVRDVHISPQDALKFGIVHRVVEFALPRGQEILQI